MGFIDCIVKYHDSLLTLGKLTDKSKLDELKQKVKSLVDNGTNPIEAERIVKNEYILSEQEALNTELNTLKKSLGVKPSKSQPQKQADVSGIEDEYKKKLVEVEEKEKTKSAEPPNIPPSEPKPVKEGGETKGVSKAILKRIVESENVSKSVKENLEKDLKYKPQSHDEARKIAKEVVKEFGEDEAVTFAESDKFGGDVNSMIFAEAIDRTFEKEQAAKTPEEKMKYAEQWADYADRYDKSARKSGRMISAVGSFYKNSPIGFMLKKRGEREQEFKEWYKGREKPFKEVFEEMKNDPDFKAYVKLEVQKATKQERAVFRQKRRTKIVDAFNKAKIKTNQVNSAIIPPQVWNAAVEVMKQATLAGELILDVIEKGVEHIKNNHKDAWDEKAFREYWEERLEGLDSDKQRVEVPEKYLERMRKKLSGMTESQKEDVIRKSFRKLVENGALEYDDFKKIVADTIGLGELSAEDVAKIQSYIKDMNDVQDLQERVVSENSKEALEAFEMGRKKAEKSATELASMVYNKPDVGKRLRSIAQLSTMSIVSLVKNPFYNIFHQLLVRMPKAVIMTSIDHTVWGISLLANKMFGTRVINPDFNVIAAQRGYFGGVAEGGKMAVKQLFTGLTNKDYFQKEVYNSQIKPFQSWKDIWDWGRGNKYLTTAQIADKVIQGTVGIPAEFVARMLNIGDKPFRFAAESAIAETIATQDLHLHGIDRKIFLAMPKEKAKDIFLKRGLSEEEAALKAEKIEQRIIKEGEEAVFQQANIISEKIEQLKKASNENAEKNPLAGFGNEAARWFGVLNMPFVKTPVNIAWEVFNLVNPEFALMQSFVYGARAAKTKSQSDYIQAKKWMAHAATGLALLSAAGYLASIGAVTGDDEDQAFNMKEAKGKEAFVKNNRLNWSKLNRAVTGGDTKDMDGDVMVDLSWWGAPGMILNMQANKQENMTKEEREKMGYVEDLLYRLKSGARDGLVNSVFSGTFTAVDAMRTGKADQWLLGMMNVGMNIFEPATVAQLSRAMQKNEYRVTDDDFNKKAQNSIKSRFFGTPPTKYNIWGDPMKKDNSFKGILWNMFGFSSFDKDAIGEPVYQDFKRTGDYNFFPSVPQPDFEVDGEKKQLPREQLDQFQVLVGQARKNYAQPFLADAAILTGYDKKYSQLSDPEKLEALKEIYKKGYDAGKEQFLVLHPEYDTREKEPDYEGDLKKKTFKSSLDYQ